MGKGTAQAGFEVPLEYWTVSVYRQLGLKCKPQGVVILADEARICPQSVVLTYERTLESPEGRIGFLIQEIWVGPKNLLSSSQVKLPAGLGTTLEKHHCLKDTGRPACSSKRSGSNCGK